MSGCIVVCLRAQKEECSSKDSKTRTRRHHSPRHVASKIASHTREYSNSNHQLSARKDENVSYLSYIVSARHSLTRNFPSYLDRW